MEASELNIVNLVYIPDLMIQYREDDGSVSEYESLGIGIYNDGGAYVMDTGADGTVSLAADAENFVKAYIKNK